jgi:hypothetical protein
VVDAQSNFAQERALAFDAPRDDWRRTDRKLGGGPVTTTSPLAVDSRNGVISRRTCSSAICFTPNAAFCAA